LELAQNLHNAKTMPFFKLAPIPIFNSYETFTALGLALHIL